MAEIKINSLEAGQAACDTLLQGINKLNLVCQSLNSNPFNPLTQCNPDLGTTFINELNMSVSDIYQFLQNNIYPAAVAYFQPDDPANPPGGDDPNNPDPPGGGGDNPDPPGGGGDNPTGPESPGGGGNQVGGGEDPGTVVPPDIIGGDSPELENLDTSSLSDMNLSDLDGYVGQLIELAHQHETPLDTLVADDKYADEIKQMIMDSPYIPQEFKDQIKDLDSTIVRQYVEKLLKGGDPDVFDLNPMTLGIMYKYLDQIAKENNITVEQLLEDPQYSELLKTTLAKFKNIVDLFGGWEDLSPEEVQEYLLKLYDGDEVYELPDEDVEIVRSFVDFITEETEIPYEDLLMDPSYAETMKDAVMSLGKSASFFYLTSEFSQEGMGPNILQMYDGTNYKAYGMDETSVTSFKAEMDALAKENNTTTDKLFTDSQYADKVKDALKNSESAKDVGSIFKSADSSVSQKVAKNLYNTEFKETATEVTGTEGTTVATNTTTGTTASTGTTTDTSTATGTNANTSKTNYVNG